MGVYHIAQMLYLLGPPAVERVSGKVYQETGMDPRRRETSGYGVEELGLGLVRLAGGVTLDLIESLAGSLSPGSKLTLINYSGTWNNGTFDGYADDSIFTLGANQWQINYNDTAGGSNFSDEQTLAAKGLAHDIEARAKLAQDRATERMSWVFSAFVLGYVVFGLTGGWLADRFRPRAIILLIVLWWSFFTAATGWVRNWGALVVTRFHARHVPTFA
jgi:hypothetical protein